MAKKLIIAALGVLLLVAFVAPVAMAETKVTFSGYYRLRYMYNFNQTLSNDTDNQWRQGFFDQRFQIEPNFIVSDNLKLQMRFRGLSDLPWGTGTYNPTPAVTFNAANQKIGYTQVGNANTFDMRRALIVYDTPYGQFAAGRTAYGSTGLTSFGYMGSRFGTKSDGMLGNAYQTVFDTDSDQNRIHYVSPTWSGFNFVLVYAKIVERDYTNIGRQPAAGWTNPGYDDDQDHYHFVPRFAWQTGGIMGHLVYVRDNANNKVVSAAPFDDNSWIFNPALVQNFGPVGFHVEGRYQYTSRTFDADISPGRNKQERSGWGLYADATWNYGPGELGLQFFYVEGNSRNNPATGDKIRGVVTSGVDWQPFLVAYGNPGVYPGWYSNVPSGNTAGTFGLNNSNNHWMVGLWNDYNITEALMLHAAVGYFGINEVMAGQSRDYGAEIDLGLSYDITKDLRFSTLGGYFFPGRWHRGVQNSAAGTVINGTTVPGYITGLGNAYSWKNELRIMF